MWPPQQRIVNLVRFVKWRHFFHTATSAAVKSKQSHSPLTYEEVYKKSIEDPEEFWEQAANQISWFKKYDRVFQTQAYPRTKWFPGGELNVCYNALDRHIEEGRGDQTAIIYDSPVTQTLNKYSYKETLDLVSKLAGQLVSLGVQPKDRVIIYMPMIPETLFGMLACARIGAVHSVVFGGFSAKELASRIRHTQPKVILSASCGIEPNRTVWYKPILDEAIRLADLPMNVKCLIYQRQNYEPATLRPGRDHDWQEVIARKTQGHDCIPVTSDHPLYILYTSGTTGFPKGVVRSTAGHAVVLPWSFKAIFGMNRGEVWWGASDLGWVVGHSYICYGPFLSRLTTVLYEGKPVGTPDAGQFYRVLCDHQVNAMFTAPSALRAIRKEDPNKVFSSKYKRPKLRYVCVAGEHCDNETRVWAKEAFNVPVLDNWWQTETGHPISATCVGLGDKQEPPNGSCGLPVPGYQIEVLQENGRPCDVGQLGRVVCKVPMPPGFMDTLFKSDDLFVAQYFQRFQGYYDTMDAGYFDEKGYLYVMARDDDVINVAGHRISTSALEEIVLEHVDVADAAVVGVVDKSKGQVPLCIYVIKHGASKTEKEINEDLVAMVRDQLGPVASFRLACAVPGLPRTRSGKTPRKSLADLASNRTCQVPPTIEDHTVYEAIQQSLRKLGLAKEATIKY